MPLVEYEGCIYDEVQLAHTHGFEHGDQVGREAFVNHIHVEGEERNQTAHRIIDSWIDEMHSRWPDYRFRIYRDVQSTEVIIRFHVVRKDQPNWCEPDLGVEIIEVVA